MEKLCKNCKYWKRNEPEDFTGAEKINYIITNLGECNSGKLNYNDQHYSYPPKSDELIYYDAEMYKATLETGPDFGCIHWRNNEA